MFLPSVTGLVIRVWSKLLQASEKRPETVDCVTLPQGERSGVSGTAGLVLVIAKKKEGGSQCAQMLEADAYQEAGDV